MQARCSAPYAECCGAQAKLEAPAYRARHSPGRSRTRGAACTNIMQEKTPRFRMRISRTSEWDRMVPSGRGLEHAAGSVGCFCSESHIGHSAVSLSKPDSAVSRQRKNRYFMPSWAQTFASRSVSSCTSASRRATLAFTAASSEMSRDGDSAAKPAAEDD